MKTHHSRPSRDENGFLNILLGFSIHPIKDPLFYDLDYCSSLRWELWSFALFMGGVADFSRGDFMPGPGFVQLPTSVALHGGRLSPPLGFNSKSVMHAMRCPSALWVHDLVSTRKRSTTLSMVTIRLFRLLSCVWYVQYFELSHYGY